MRVEQVHSVRTTREPLANIIRTGLRPPNPSSLNPGTPKDIPSHYSAPTHSASPIVTPLDFGKGFVPVSDAFYQAAVEKAKDLLPKSPKPLPPSSPSAAASPSTPATQQPTPSSSNPLPPSSLSPAASSPATSNPSAPDQKKVDQQPLPSWESYTPPSSYYRFTPHYSLPPSSGNQPISYSNYLATAPSEGVASASGVFY